MARVDLYYPPFKNEFENKHYPVNPPLGLMYLAAVLREAGHTPRIFDLRLYPKPRGLLEKIWSEQKPDVIGVSSVTHMARYAYNLVAYCKERLPDVPLIMGGPHVTAYNKDVLRDSHTDVGVRYEGEPVIVPLVESLAKGKLDTSLPNLIYRKGDDIVMNDNTQLVEDLNTLPFPAWEFADIGAYSKRQSMALLPDRRYATVISSRGCPYRCSYCHNIFGKTVRFLDARSFVDHLERLYYEHDIRHFEIVDDIFNVNKERVFEICDDIRRRGMEPYIAFPNALRSDLLDKEVIDALYGAGTRLICFAIESASPRIQKLVKKNLNIERAREAIEYANSKGILSCGFFMLGFPTETEEELRMTTGFALKSDLHFAFFFIVTPYRGTELGEKYIPKNAEDYTLYNYDYGVANIASVPFHVIEKIRREAIAGFYSNPKRILRLFQLYPMLHKMPVTAGRAVFRQLRRQLVYLKIFPS
ncbi:MAG: radical SAM protein [Myxococcota bacterium]